MKNQVRLTFNVTEQENAILNSLAEEHGKTKTTLLRDGIQLTNWLDKVTDRGATILVKEKDGTIREVVFR